MSPKVAVAADELTDTDRQKIADFVAGVSLSAGFGPASAPDSVTAINLALTGELTDRVPPAMSEVVGRWMVFLGDRMPDSIRNGARWKGLIPLAASTGRDLEQARLRAGLVWMLGRVFPSVQSYADGHGFGAEWKALIAAGTAAGQAKGEAVRQAAVGLGVAAQRVVNAAGTARTVDVVPPSWVADALPGSPEWATRAVWAAWETAAARADQDAVWAAFDPCGLVESLIAVTG